MGRATSKRDDHKDEPSETVRDPRSRPHELVLLDAPHGVFNGPSTVTRVPLDDEPHHESGREGRQALRKLP